MKYTIVVMYDNKCGWNLYCDSWFGCVWKIFWLTKDHVEKIMIRKEQ